MKDELGGQTMKEFVGLRAKTYSYLKENNDEDKKAKLVNNFAFISTHRFHFNSRRQVTHPFFQVWVWKNLENVGQKKKKKKKSHKKGWHKRTLKFENYQKCIEAAQIKNEINHFEKNKIDVDSPKEFIKNNNVILKIQQRFKTERHNIFAEEINKFWWWAKNPINWLDRNICIWNW